MALGSLIDYLYRTVSPSSYVPMPTGLSKELDVSHPLHQTHCIHLAHKIRQHKFDKQGDKEKLDLAIKLLKQFGSCSLDGIQRGLRLTAQSWKVLIQTPHVKNGVEERLLKTQELCPEYQELLQSKYPKARFFEHIAHMGYTSQPMTILEADGEKYVLRMREKDRAQKYLEQYKSLQASQHRPPIIPVTLKDGRVVMLSKFMGSESIDFRNEEHMRMLATIVDGFIKNNCLIDFHKGNVRIHKGALYYIDKDFEERNFDSLQESELCNLRCISNEIDEYLPPDEASAIKELFKKSFQKDLS